VASLAAKSGASSGTRSKQALRALNRINDDQTKAFFKKHGVTQDMDAVARLQALQGVLTDPQADAQLKQAGFGNTEERAALIAMGENLPVLIDRRERFRKVADDQAGVVAKNKAYLAGKQGSDATATAAQEYATYVRGTQGQELAIARKAAVAEMLMNNEIDTADTEFRNWIAQHITSPTYDWAGNLGPYQESIDAKAGQRLIRQGKKAGMDLEAQHPGLHHGHPRTGPGGGIGGLVPSPEMPLGELLNEVAPQLRAQGLQGAGDMDAVQSGIDAMLPPPARGAGNAPPPPPAAAPGPAASTDGVGVGIKELVAETRQTNEILRRIGRGEPTQFGGADGPYRPGGIA
jgi:hypothetical protein